MDRGQSVRSRIGWATAARPKRTRIARPIRASKWDITDRSHPKTQLLRFCAFLGMSDPGLFELHPGVDGGHGQVEGYTQEQGYEAHHNKAPQSQKEIPLPQGPEQNRGHAGN